MQDLLKAVHLYFEGIHECDVSKLKEVFHPESSLFDADNYDDWYINDRIKFLYDAK